MIEKVLISLKDLNADDPPNYAEGVKALMKNQKENWKQLAAGYESLSAVQTKEFYFDGFKIILQHNPGRLASTSAKVDEESINSRECFLCYQNLPAEQKGILFGNNYIVLANPFPIFHEHFTIANVDHLPQQIADSFGVLLSLSRHLAEYYTVFYNGPKCGASAPDHLHFQAGEKYFMPIDNEFHLLKNEYGVILFESDNFTASAVDDGLRRFITFESHDHNLLEEAFEIFYRSYSKLTGQKEEPMMNILSFYEQEFGWRLIIFLREKHRPSHYFAEGEKNIMLSPASVDIGGVCITPLKKDFDKISKEHLKEIFTEISISKEYFEFLKQRLMVEL